MALLDYLYLSASPENKKCSSRKRGAKENRAKALKTSYLHLRGQTLLVFLSQNKPNSKKSWDLSCLKPTVFGYALV
jgi:hypothetical protein